MPRFLPQLARTSPVKDASEVVPALEAGLAAVRAIPSVAGEADAQAAESSSLAWDESTGIARMHSALDFILRTVRVKTTHITHSHT